MLNNNNFNYTAPLKTELTSVLTKQKLEVRPNKAQRKKIYKKI